MSSGWWNVVRLVKLLSGWWNVVRFVPHWCRPCWTNFFSIYKSANCLKDVIEAALGFFFFLSCILFHRVHFNCVYFKWAMYILPGFQFFHVRRKVVLTFFSDVWACINLKLVNASRQESDLQIFLKDRHESFLPLSRLGAIKPENITQHQAKS